MQTKKTLILFLLGAAMTAIAACGDNKESGTADSYEYTDDYGNTVNVPKEPSRIVSLSPAVTEIIFALDADTLLVGRTEFCKYPPEASNIENIGGISNMNVEKVLSLNPDLIISGSMIPRRVVEKIESMGVPMVCVIEKQHFSALFDNISAIGKLIGREQKADSLNKTLIDRMGRLDTTAVDRKSVYYVVGYGSGGNFTAGGNTFINDIIRMAGGTNVASKSEGWTFSVEALMDANPDYILIRKEDSADFCRTSPYNRLSAVKEGRLVALEDGILDLQVPRNIEAIARLREIMH